MRAPQYGNSDYSVHKLKNQFGYRVKKEKMAPQADGLRFTQHTLIRPDGSIAYQGHNQQEYLATVKAELQRLKRG
jgi:hypothetical protein